MTLSEEHQPMRSHVPEGTVLGLAVLVFTVGLGILVWSVVDETIRPQSGLLVGSFVLTSGLLATAWASARRSATEQETALLLDVERRKQERETAQLNREQVAEQAKLARDEQSRQAGEQLIVSSEQERKLHSAQRRTELSRRLDATLPRLCSDDPTLQSAAITELLFQIDDWAALINAEVDAEFAPEKRRMLVEESRRRRQELFNLAFNSEINNQEVLKARCDGLVQRLHKDAAIRPLDDVDKTRLVLGIQVAQRGASTGTSASTQAQFDNVQFPPGLRLSGNLSGLNFRGAELPHANLSGADLRGCDLQGADLQGCDLRKASLLGADLMDANLQGADLRGADLQKVNAQNTCFSNADLQETDLEGAYLVGADLQGARLQQANLRLSNIQQAKLQQVDLERADLQHADLRGANLHAASLAGANFRESRLRETDMQRSDLQNADLQGADLQQAKLQDAKLQGANLHKANLKEASLLGAESDEVTSFSDAQYDVTTVFLDGLSPSAAQMLFVGDGVHPADVRAAEPA